MKKSKAQQLATNRYNKSNYDQLNIRIPLGKKSELNELCESKGISTSTLINKFVDDILFYNNTGYKSTDKAIEYSVGDAHFIFQDFSE